jgi:tRNA-splicing ligase RtcB
MSRHASIKANPVDKVIQELDAQQIYLRAKSRRVISEEAPEAYKDIDEVVEISHQSGIARRVARMRPLGVVKG